MDSIAYDVFLGMIVVFAGVDRDMRVVPFSVSRFQSGKHIFVDTETTGNG